MAARFVCLLQNRHLPAPLGDSRDSERGRADRLALHHQ